MERKTIVPRDIEREFRINELFFSTTDPRGIITSGNRVFVRVSGYELDELLHQPHSVIRHPEMPRCVFQLLWEYLEGGKAIAAYVKNLASDGSYYWVLALACPAADGYLSVRFKPSSALLPVVKSLYRELRAIEEREGDRGEARKSGMARSRKALEDALKTHGFESYDAFMRAAIREELKSRDDVLAKELLTIVPSIPSESVDNDREITAMGRVRRIAHLSRTIYATLNSLYQQLDTFAIFTQELEDKSKYVLELSRGFRLISENTAVRSARLGDRGRSLGVIAEHMSGSAKGIESIVSDLTKRITKLTGQLRSIIFELASARLQLEMVMVFCSEVINENEFHADTKRMVNILQDTFRETFRSATTSLCALRDELRDLDSRSDELRKTILSLRFSQLTGTVEACRIEGAESFYAIFGEVNSQLEHARAQLSDLGQLIMRIHAHVQGAPAVVESVNTSLVSTAEELSALP